MKWLCSMLLLALMVAGTWAPHRAHAASPRIPATYYPPGAHISYHSALSNDQVDCMWGFFCDGGGIPLFHVTTQDQLHRLSGWGQFAALQQRGRTTMAFELFVSQYDPVLDETGLSWSEHAFVDLTMTVDARGYRLDRSHAQLLPAPAHGGTLVTVKRSGGQDLLIMASWYGSLEIEGIALYDRSSPAARHTAWTLLALQIQHALNPGP